MNLPSCNDLATKAELQQLRDQIVQLLGQREDSTQPPTDVLQAGSFAGTLVGGGLLLGLDIVENPATKAVEVIKRGVGGVTKTLSGATSGLSKVASTAKGAAAGAGAALSANADLLIDLGNLGVAVTNLATIKVLGSQLEKSENSIIGLSNNFNHVYSHLVTANENIVEANNNITTLENTLIEASDNIETLKNDVTLQQDDIDVLERNLKISVKNNSILKQNVETLKTDLTEYETYATQEIGTLKSNVEILENNLDVTKKTATKY